MVVNVFLFDDFEVMDAFGPVEIFGRVPEHFYVRFISLRGGLITGKQEIKIWTEPLNPVEIEDRELRAFFIWREKMASSC